MSDASTYQVPAEQIAWMHGLSRTELMQFASNWIETAQLHAKNEDYWRQRALKAEGKSDAEIEDWGH